MTEKSQIGKIGEDIAAEYLKTKGYKIVNRNFRKPWGEIDIIAKSPEKILVFVEVKTMVEYAKLGLKPEDQLTKSKLNRLQRTASLYAGHYPELVENNKGWRIDLVAIILPAPPTLTNGIKNCNINHYKNIASE